MGIMKRLIHNRMTVSEQFTLMHQFIEITDQAWRVNAEHSDYDNIEKKRDYIEERFGICCKVLHTNNVFPPKLVEPRIVDEKKCLFYLIGIQ